MARNRRSPRQAAPVAENNVLADWERELMGLPPLSAPKPGPTRAQRRADKRRVARYIDRNRNPRRVNRGKPKTAEHAARRKIDESYHKRGSLTSTGKPRKSRRSLRREIYGASPEQD